MHLITCYVLKYISLQQICYRVWVTRRVKKPARVQVWVRTQTRMRVWVFSGYELELASAGMERHYPTGFYPLSSLNTTETPWIHKTFSYCGSIETQQKHHVSVEQAISHQTFLRLQVRRDLHVTALSSPEIPCFGTERPPNIPRPNIFQLQRAQHILSCFPSQFVRLLIFLCP
jgi:hypothetical protein